MPYANVSGKEIASGTRTTAKGQPSAEVAGEGRRTETQDLRPLKVARKKSSDGFAVLAHAATNVRAAYSEDKGRRHEFEDLAVVTHDARGDKTTQLRVSFFAVLDGHAGRRAAEHAGAKLHDEAMHAGLIPANLASSSAEINLKAVKEAILSGFQRTDASFLAQAKSNGWQDGAAAAALWIIGERVVVANVGDVKAVLARTQGEAVKAVTVTKDHKAIYPTERARIERAGGHIQSGRIAGRLEVSRSFGDMAFKSQGASSVPNVTSFELSSRDEFVLLACDGFWGLWSPDDAVAATMGLLHEGMEPKAITNRLLNITVRERRCKDNCTVMLLHFVRDSVGTL
eukprot:jgi/Tetstr1/426083/TSEL_016414.t1